MPPCTIPLKPSTHLSSQLQAPTSTPPPHLEQLKPPSKIGQKSPNETLRRDGDGEASEEQVLEGNDDGRVLEQEPLELERGPGAKEKGERGDGSHDDRGVDGGKEGGRGGEEEGDLGEDKGETHDKEGSRLEAEGVKDGDDRGATEDNEE
ncbi:hypothetical protein LR48_Vigan10g251900 [Vigna angularis]|uniref:Uncharacterized protein n=1 Tax=Phaseolus angularis TaxID=3914 RepID=A0A0L9VNZ9_PHAAN|nr:hypothetical protein LR48_Vigan10g251900 [Vigna angularis]